MKKVGVLLSGCGVYDGSEIHESVLTFLALSKHDLDYVCIAPDIKQTHVINHVDGNEIKSNRNVLIESARIARGDILSLSEVDFENLSSIVLPGGFGAAKNLSDWAFKGFDCEVMSEVKNLILHCIENQKPIVSLCVSPIIIAKSLEGHAVSPHLTFGNVYKESDYDIKEFNLAVESLGSTPIDVENTKICVDEKLKIISVPCYMMKLSVKDVSISIENAVNQLFKFLIH